MGDNDELSLDDLIGPPLSASEIDAEELTAEQEDAIRRLYADREALDDIPDLDSRRRNRDRR